MICHLVAIVFVHDVDKNTLLSELGQLMVVFRSESLVFGLGWERHDRDRYVRLSHKSVFVIHAELVDAVNVVAEQADDPLVRAIVDFVVNSDLIILNNVVLPLICLFKSTFQSDRLWSLTSTRCKDIVDLTIWNLPQYVLLHFHICVAVLEYYLILHCLLGYV